MDRDRFFETARGKILAALRRRGAATAYDLAQEFGLSTNAVRQQCILLERDNLITGTSVRRSKTKPTVEYRLAPAAEKYFPHRYDRMLNAVLRAVRDIGGPTAVQDVFTSMGQRQSQRLNSRFGDKSVAARVSALADALRESGVEVEAERTESGFRIREYNCPFSVTVAEHPEICGVMGSIVRQTIAPDVVQTQCMAGGASECTFEIETGNEGEGG